ncbi:MAG: CTP synthase [Chloroflexota bacterium]
MPKYVFVTGGVASSVGKGITVASIGRLLKSRGLSVSAQKFDPYLNVDPGTMNPYQHGEVFVTDDGAETDLDLGHYERFMDVDLTRDSNVTMGKVYASVIGKERHGDFLGGTIQVIPHITNEIKEWILSVGKRSNVDVVIVEVGGTVGDIEGQPVLETIRQLRRQLGHGNSLFIHVTLLPYIGSSGELKTKPTQHSVKELRSMGIQPDAIVLRSDYPISDDIKEKVALFCDVEQRAVVPLLTADSIYAVPLILETSEFGEFVVERLNLHAEPPELEEWRNMVESMRQPKPEVRIGLIGKYVQLPDAYLSVREALHHAGLRQSVDVVIDFIDSERLETADMAEVERGLRDLHGIVVPGGFGYRGIEGKINAARFARENRVPYLGLCLGMQMMVIEAARNLLGLKDANSTEFDPVTANPVIDLMPDQRGIANKGGTMRLGRYPCHLVEGTRAHAAYAVDDISERHRHRFEFNNDYLKPLTEVGLKVSGHSPDGSLVEITEVADHPWMVGSQFHPEFKSRPNRPHPLFVGFIGACRAFLRDGDQRPLPLQQMWA